jgi:hypothetical protein
VTTRNPEPETRNIRRSRRMYVLWAIALTLLISTALFCWLVVVPVWQVGPHLAKLSEMRSAAGGRDPFAYSTALDDTVRNLGGPALTSRRLANYLRYPQWVAPYRGEAFHVLMKCGEQGEAALRQLMKHGRPDDRPYAAGTLEAMEVLKESQKP